MSVEIRVYNPDLELLGVIDEFSSLIWIRRYQTAGEFELHTPYSEESRRLLVAENIIQKFDGNAVTEACVIEYLQMNHNEIVVKGHTLEIYFERRLIEFLYSTGTIEAALRGVISTMQTEPDRAIPHLELGTNHGLTETLDFQATLKTISSVFTRVCKAASFGYRIRPDFSERKLYFEVYKGVDRTTDEAEKVIFSETYDNLLNESYTYDSMNYKTVACASQLIEDVRYSIFVGTASGLDRREVHVPTNVEASEKTLQDILAEMARIARNTLSSDIVAESFTFSTDTKSTFKYREDYDLGDNVIVNHQAWKIYQNLRITEIEEDYAGSVVNVILTVGSPLPETIEEI